MLLTYATTVQSLLGRASAPVRHDDRSPDGDALVSAELPPRPPFRSRRMTATTRPIAPPPIAIGDPDTPRRSVTCEGSSRARRRMRMTTALPEGGVVMPWRRSDETLPGRAAEVNP